MQTALPLVIAAALASTAAPAQPLSFNDPAPGYSAILQADYASAEREIRDADISKYDAARSINLGIVYAKTGRTEAAERMFRRAMLMDDVPIVVADQRTSSSHDVASRALAMLNSGALGR